MDKLSLKRFSKELAKAVVVTNDMDSIKEIEKIQYSYKGLKI